MGNWSSLWGDIVDVFDAIIGGLSAIFKIPINFIIDGINLFIGAANKIKVPDWVPGVGGMGFTIPKIPRLKVGMDYVPSDFFPAYLDEGEGVLTKEENAKYRGGNLNSLAGPSQSARGQTINVDQQGMTKADFISGLLEFKKSNPQGDIVIQVGYDELGRAAKKGIAGLEFTQST